MSCSTYISKVELEELAIDMKSSNESIRLLAFDKLYKSMYDKLVIRAKIQYLKGDIQYAEDMAIDTLMRVREKIHQYKNIERKFSAWIYKILHNNCLQLRKSLKTSYIDSCSNESSSTGLNKMSLDVLVEQFRNNTSNDAVVETQLTRVNDYYKKCLKAERLLVFELKMENYTIKDIKNILNTTDYNKKHPTLADISVFEFTDRVAQGLVVPKYKSGNAVKILYTRAKDTVIKFIDYHNSSDKTYTFNKYVNLVAAVETKILKLRKNLTVTLEHLYQLLIFTTEQSKFDYILTELNISRLDCDSILLWDYMCEFECLINVYLDELSQFGTGVYIPTWDAFKFFSDKELLTYYRNNTSINTKINSAFNRDTNKALNTKKSVSYPSLNVYNYELFDFDLKKMYNNGKGC